MTTIAANLELMASDTLCTAGSASFKTRKIERKGDALIGCAGKASDCSKFIAWYGTGLMPPEISDEEFEALILTPAGLFFCESDCAPMLLKDKYYAIGSGWQGALVAMDKGDDPKRAVEAACKRDIYSSGPVEVVYLKGK